MIYLLIPILFLALTPFLYDSTTLLRLSIISIVPLGLLFVKPVKLLKYKVLAIPFLITLLWYLLSWKMNEQTYADFLFGFYGRGFGILTLLGCFLTTLIVADNIKVESIKYIKNTNRLIILAISYGLIQYFGFDPLKWESANSEVLLTLGNTNFSSALLGIVSTVPLYKLFHSGLKKNIASIFTIVIIIFLIINTNSSQGFVLLLVNILLLSLLFFSKKFSIKKLKNSMKLSILVFAILFIPVTYILSTLGFNDLVNYLNKAFQVDSRIQHWSLGVRMWRDNPIFGVGIDGMGLNSSKYLSEKDAKVWGNYVFPDKAHNEMIDNFVNGGIVVGLSQLFSILIITYFALKLLRQQTYQAKNEALVISIIMWFGYSLQLTFSTSQIFIKFLGSVLAGVIVGCYINHDNNQKNYKNVKKLS